MLSSPITAESRKSKSKAEKLRAEISTKIKSKKLKVES